MCLKIQSVSVVKDPSGIIFNLTQILVDRNIYPKETVNEYLQSVTLSVMLQVG